MAGGKRGRPLLNSSRRASAQTVTEEDLSDGFDDKDDIENYVAERHARMAGKEGLDSPENDGAANEPEIAEHSVLKLGLSDSDESDSDSLDDDEAAYGENGEKEDWGGRKHNWYGGDTHEYEIMEDEEREEILQDEEEEAIRLQKKALHRSLPEDYLQDDDEFEETDDDEEDEDRERNAQHSALSMNVSAPELDLLATEFQKSREQLSVLKEKRPLNETDRIRCRLLSLFAANVALYFSVRTDPDSVGVDLRTHPVLSRIVQTRSLLQRATAAAAENLAIHNSDEGLDEKEVKHSEYKEKAENGVMTGENTKSTNGLTTENGPMKENGSVKENGSHEKRKKDKRKKKRRAGKENSIIAEDEERIQSLLQPITHVSDDEEDQAIRDRKRRKLNKILGAMERQRKNDSAKRMAPADLDVVREEARPRDLHTDRSDRITENEAEVRANGAIDDDEVMSKMLAKKEKKEMRKAKKANASTPHVYTFKDEVRRDGKRKASHQIVNNRGLTRYRPRDKKTPRTKNRHSYGKAVVRRKGAVREYAGANGGSYGGEASGINMSARKSSMLG